MYLPTLRLSKQTENVMQFPSQPKWFKGRNGTSFHCEQQSQTNQKTWMKRNILSASCFCNANLKDSECEGKHRDLVLTQHFPCRTHQVMTRGGSSSPMRTLGHRSQTPHGPLHLTSWNCFPFSLSFRSREHLELSAFCRYQLKASVSLFSLCSNAAY